MPRIPIYKTSLKDLSTTKRILLSKMQSAYKELLIITQKSQSTSAYSCLLISFISNNIKLILNFKPYKSLLIN